MHQRVEARDTRLHASLTWCLCGGSENGDREIYRFYCSARKCENLETIEPTTIFSFKRRRIRTCVGSTTKKFVQNY